MSADVPLSPPPTPEWLASLGFEVKRVDDAYHDLKFSCGLDLAGFQFDNALLITRVIVSLTAYDNWTVTLLQGRLPGARGEARVDPDFKPSLVLLPCARVTQAWLLALLRLLVPGDKRRHIPPLVPQPSTN